MTFCRGKEGETVFYPYILVHTDIWIGLDGMDWNGLYSIAYM